MPDTPPAAAAAITTGAAAAAPAAAAAATDMELHATTATAPVQLIEMAAAAAADAARGDVLRALDGQVRVAYTRARALCRARGLALPRDHLPIPECTAELCLMQGRMPLWQRFERQKAHARRCMLDPRVEGFPPEMCRIGFTRTFDQFMSELAEVRARHARALVLQQYSGV